MMGPVGRTMAAVTLSGGRTPARRNSPASRLLLLALARSRGRLVVDECSGLATSRRSNNVRRRVRQLHQLMQQ